MATASAASIAHAGTVPGRSNQPALGERGAVKAAAKAKPGVRHGAAGAFKSGGRIVKDTCPGHDKACIDKLVQNCDKAGGGLSTWEDGSVDCYVVGIHDQP